MGVRGMRAGGVDFNTADDGALATQLPGGRAAIWRDVDGWVTARLTAEPYEERFPPGTSLFKAAEALLDYAGQTNCSRRQWPAPGQVRRFRNSHLGLVVS